MKKLIAMRIAASLMLVTLSASISVFSQEDKKEESK